MNAALGALAALASGALAALPLPVLTDLGQALDEDGRAAVYINFFPDRAVLTPSGQEEVARVAAALRRRPDQPVVVADSVDSLAEPELNMALSQARAKIVRDALVALGVSPARLSARGDGDTRPIYDKYRQDLPILRNERVDLEEPDFAGLRRALPVEARDAESDDQLVFRRVPAYYILRSEEYDSATDPRLSALAGGPVTGRQSVITYRHLDADLPGARLPTVDEILEEYEQGMERSNGFLIQKSLHEVVLALAQEKSRTWVDVVADSGRQYTVTTLIEPLP